MKRMLFWLLPLLCILLLAGCGAREASSIGVIGESQPAAPASTNTATDTVVQDTGQETILDIVNQAKQGLVPGCEFPVKVTSIEEVYKKWGEPGNENAVPAAKGTFAIYWSKRIVIGYNSDSVVFDIRAYSDSIKKITLSSLTETLGSPESERQLNKESILVYPAGKEYKLRFVFPQITRENPNPYLDHISLQYPPGNTDNTESQ